MKNTIKIFGIIAFATIIGLTFVACGAEQGHNVFVGGTPIVGHTITATSEGTFQGNFSWQISSRDGAFNWGTLGISGDVSGSNRQNLELRTGAVGRYIRVSRRTQGGDTIFSNPIGPIQAP